MLTQNVQEKIAGPFVTLPVAQSVAALAQITKSSTQPGVNVNRFGKTDLNELLVSPCVGGR